MDRRQFLFGAAAGGGIGMSTMFGLGEASQSGMYVDPRSFGGVGDGSTDDTMALQSAINAALGSTVFLPPGAWRYQELHFPAMVSLLGVGRGSVLQPYSDQSTIYIAGTSGIQDLSSVFANFQVRAPAWANPNWSTGIVKEHCSTVHFQNVRISGFDVCIAYRNGGAIRLTYDFCSFAAKYAAIRAESCNNANLIGFTHCDFHDAEGYAITQDDNAASLFRALALNTCDLSTHHGPGSIYLPAGVVGLELNNDWFEATDGNWLPVNLGGHSYSRILGVAICSCTFGGSNGILSSVDAMRISPGGNATSVRVQDNVIEGYKYGISFSQSFQNDKVILTPNHFDARGIAGAEEVHYY